MNPFGVGLSHGKIIWFGEHAVVYHHPAIALPLNQLRVHIKMDPSSKTELISPFFNGPLTAGQGLDGWIALLEALREKLPLNHVRITLETTLPVGAGFGASAAIASALVMAAYDLCDHPLDQKTHFDLIQISEQIFHTNPSGIDAFLTMTTHPQRYRKDQSPQALSIDLNASLVIAHSNIKGSTKDAVEHIASAMQDKKIMKHMADLGHLTVEALDAIQAKNIPALGRLMNAAHGLLQTVGVSHPVVDGLVQEALNQHALGAKISGGGLGGIMIALYDDEAAADRFITHLQTQGFTTAFKRSLRHEN